MTGVSAFFMAGIPFIPRVKALTRGKPRGFGWSFEELQMQRIKGYHAHVYFDAGTIDQARALCEQAAQLFPLQMGRVHQRPVGPHPDWSCQLAFDPQYIGVVLPWLALNRNGLVIFLHPDTGDDLADHTDHAIWMGAVRPLNLSAFEVKH
jgi:DOPA 4,5-dioxygenase